jgi:hypothetical protein
VNCLYARGCFLLASGFRIPLILDRTPYGSNQLAILECVTLQLVASPSATLQLYPSEPSTNASLDAKRSRLLSVHPLPEDGLPNIHHENIILLHEKQLLIPRLQPPQRLTRRDHSPRVPLYASCTSRGVSAKVPNQLMPLMAHRPPTPAPLCRCSCPRSLELTH